MPSPREPGGHHGDMSFRWITVFLDFPRPRSARGSRSGERSPGTGCRPRAGNPASSRPCCRRTVTRTCGYSRVVDGPGGCHLDLHVDTAAESLDVGRQPRRPAAGPACCTGLTRTASSSPAARADSAFCLVRWAGETAVPGPLVTASGVTRVDTLCIDVPPQRVRAGVLLLVRADRLGSGARAGTGVQLPRTARRAAIAGLAPPAATDAAPRGQRARAHVDFGCTDELAVGRHVALGARVAAAHEHWTILNDPTGREYCLVKREPHAAS